jgi:hydroxymethylpyrimidine/phosphomethylpyrimidine kinase
MQTKPAVLVIAASDSSGGAGITRDAETLTRFGVDGLYAVTAVTAQSDARLFAVHPVPVDLLIAQITAALETRTISAIKIGMLGTGAIVQAVAQNLPARDTIPIVLDPVLSSTSGGLLIDDAGRKALREHLLPRVTLVTPNVPETATLLGEAPVEQEAELLNQARQLKALGPQAVLLKGGHASGPNATDLLVVDDASPVMLTSPRLNATRRGTGCALSSAIAAGLALRMPLADACRRAKAYVTDLLR